MNVTASPPILGIPDIATPRAQPAPNESPAPEQRTNATQSVQAAPESGKGQLVDKTV